MENKNRVATLNKSVMISLFGNGLEWYDFTIFGYFAPILGRNFFPYNVPYLSVLSTLAVLTVGFISRPIGAYVLGKMGDQYGRKRALLFSIFLMAISTALMGVLPTYETAGIIAPIFLITLRILQGFSLGGEFTSSLTFLFEHAPRHKKGFIGAWAFSGAYLGSIFGATISIILTVILSEQELYKWGWRIPLILGFFIAITGFYLRRKVEESPSFLQLKNSHSLVKNPLKEIAKQHYKQILQTIGLLLPNTVWAYVFVFLPTYLTEMKKWNFSSSIFINFVPSIFLFLFLPVAGRFSDIFGRKKILYLGQCGLIFLSPFAFYVFEKGYVTNVIAMQLMIALFYSFSYGPLAALMAELFPTNVRNTAVAISYNLATGIFGGITPLALSYFTLHFGFMYGSLIYLSGSSLIGIISLLSMKQKRQYVLG
ncbi:Proline porter II [Candidatus Rubidus massiliensis]|nr:Proline porter II [Candidatus Rubidus massiliensis]